MPDNAYNPKDIAQFAYNAGFRGEALTVAVAVAMAESGGRSNAMGDVGIQTGTWGPSVGFWQIRSLKKAARGSTRDQNANLDPTTNAKHAYEISGGGKNFHPWTTYTSGAYTKYLQAARGAAAGVSPDGTVPAYKAGSSGGNSGGATAVPQTNEVPGGMNNHDIGTHINAFMSLLSRPVNTGLAGGEV